MGIRLQKSNQELDGVNPATGLPMLPLT